MQSVLGQAACVCVGVRVNTITLELFELLA